VSALASSATRAVLERIWATGEAHDAAAKARFQARRAECGSRLPASEAAELYKDAAFAVAPDVGLLLYALALARRAACIVEFGTAFGASTIHLAAAIRDGGGRGRVVATELHPDKARIATRNLSEAGLADLVELRVGDALDTLRDLDEPVDLLFLDGFGDLYLPVLRLVEPSLSPSAVVAADESAGNPYWPEYSAYVRDPRNGYASVSVPLDDGVEVSVRVAAGS
jgi:predicted O-methyltransferase YrrM